MELNYIIKPFRELNPLEMYEIFKLRYDVFVIEQNCIFDEFDNYDQNSIHLQMRNENNELIAYSRIIPPGQKNIEASFGRFVLKKEYRGKGIANELATETINQIVSNFGEVPIKIEAQSYLQKFYGRHNFIAISEPYVWDDILHVDMLRKI